jgi:hypothetical protein
MQIIAWERPDGKISISYPAYMDIVRDLDITDSQVIHKFITKHQPLINAKFGGVCTPHIIDSTDLPDDELFDAFVWDDGVKVNMELAVQLGLLVN